jgi:hypothetical protein
VRTYTRTGVQVPSCWATSSGVGIRVVSSSTWPTWRWPRSARTRVVPRGMSSALRSRCLPMRVRAQPSSTRGCCGPRRPTRRSSPGPLSPSPVEPRRRSLTAFDVCTTRALRAEITRHHPARAVTWDPFSQYNVAPFGYCRTAPANSKTLESESKSSGKFWEPFGFPKTVGSKRELVPRGRGGEEAPAGGRPQRCNDRLTGFVHSITTLPFLEVSRARARSVRTVQRRSRIGRDEDGAAMANRVSAFRHSAFSSRSGSIEGRSQWDLAMRPACACHGSIAMHSSTTEIPSRVRGCVRC